MTDNASTSRESKEERPSANTLPGSQRPAAGDAREAGSPLATPLAGEDREKKLLDEEYRQAQDALGKRVPLAAKVAIPAVLALMFFASFMMGKYPVPPQEILNTVAGQIVVTFSNLFLGTDIQLTGASASALFGVRLPRIAVVMLVGAALSISGAAYQGMFKNPLVSPDLLGASAGASFGACLALLLDMPGYMVQVFAFCGGMIAVSCAVWLNRLVRSDPILGLVLGGILVSTLFQSGTSLVKLLADANDKLPTITFWLMGSFASIKDTDLTAIIVPMICGFALLLLEGWKLNVLSFGDEEARSMGIRTKRVRLVVIFASTLIVSCSVAVAGIVGWVGLVIPHLARALVGPNYRVLLPASMLIGASYLLIVDNIARLAATVEIPIGILTSILGVPFFIFIFLRNQKGW